MTEQVPETVKINGKRYVLCGVRGEGLFDAAQHGIQTLAPHTACRRGFVCSYRVKDGRFILDALQLWSEPHHWPHNRTRLERLFGDRLPLDDEHAGVDAEGLALPVPFTGGLLLGEGLIEELDVHIGFHPAARYRRVLELTFESGRLLATADRSAEMAEVRERDDHGESSGKRDLVKWIDDSFRLDY